MSTCKCLPECFGSMICFMDLSEMFQLVFDKTNCSNNRSILWTILPIFPNSPRHSG